MLTAWWSLPSMQNASYTTSLIKNVYNILNSMLTVWLNYTLPGKTRTLAKKAWHLAYINAWIIAIGPQQAWRMTIVFLWPRSWLEDFAIQLSGCQVQLLPYLMIWITSSGRFLRNLLHAFRSVSRSLHSNWLNYVSSKTSYAPKCTTDFASLALHAT